MPNRYICDVIAEIRTSIRVGRIDMLRGLTEEIQTMANRMEAKLADYSNIGYDLERGADFRRRLKQLKKEADTIDEKLEGDYDGTRDEVVLDLAE